MKRFLIVLVVLCAIANTARGESIAVRMNAPETVLLPAVNLNGVRSGTKLEAKVIVPNVERVPVLQVKIDEITEERLFAAADVLGRTDINRKPSAWEEDVYPDGGKYTWYSGYASGWKGFNLLTRYQCIAQPKAVTHSDLYSNDLQKAEYSLGQMSKPYPTIPWEGTMTRDMAYKLAQETIGAFTQGYDYTMEVEGVLGGYAQLTDADIAAINSGKKDSASIPKVPYAFSFYFAPIFEGIPLTQHDNPHPWQSEKDIEYAASAKFTMPEAIDSRLQVIVLDEGVHALQWRNPLTRIGTAQEDTRLLPFEDILEKGLIALEHYCLTDLTDDFGNDVGWDAVVTEIRFGYLCRQMAPGSMDLRLVPVWDFMINRKMDRSDTGNPPYDFYGQAAVTLSAEDGSVISRFGSTLTKEK